MTRLNSDYTPILLSKSENRRLARKRQSPVQRGYYVQGAYDHTTDQIILVKFNKAEIYEQVKDHNKGERTHRSGFNVKRRRSYARVERMLPGFGKITDVRQHFGYILSHESLHKAIRKIAGSKTSHKFDEVFI